jgi:hypothetical protein
MKIFTAGQLKFAVTMVVFTLFFRYSLSTLLNKEEFFLAWMVAAAYALIVFLAGWYFAKEDYRLHLFRDLGFGFHLVTYLVCNLVAETWFFLGLNSSHEPVLSVHLTALFWGLGLIIHLVICLVHMKNTIRGIDKTEIFE